MKDLYNVANSKILDGKAADVWSLGITLYCLLHGRPPFEDENIVTLSQRIISEEITYHDYLSPLLKELLVMMLKKNPSDRISIPEIKVHPWVSRRGAEPMLSTEENCIYEEITEEELENAFSPSVTFVTKIMDKLRFMSHRRESEENVYKSRAQSTVK